MTQNSKKYNKTLLACYLGFITQAITANFTPLLFLMFNKSYEVSLGKIALIPAVFFLTQLVVDIICAQVVDKIGYRKCIITSCLCSAAGLILLAFLPELFPDPFVGIIISVVVYAIGSGLVEVLGSPIVEACPFDHKEAVMSLLHSFYCWGSVGVIVISTLFFKFLGIGNWKILACIWAVIPLYNIYNFATCPIEQPNGGEKGMGLVALFKLPLFWVAIILMICAGASELSMAQWASAFAESALGLSKNIGDLAGPCLFAVAMGTVRAFFGKFGHKLNLMRFMIFSGALCVVSYLLASLSSIPMLGLLGCILCGFSVAIMWPGTISICSPRIPKGGTALFAMLAMSGDLGGAAGPALVGNISQIFSNNLKAGLLVGTAFPVVLILMILLIPVITKSKAK
ncbi:Fucose permease [Treponema bryantii]|uniref:Fucose permease n=1 Tax=Treponema bryantii TaxID=163 RepID=A0A1H9D0E7_9SPIR|nr:MFS transporter [Treponema bryantii]SEQ06293.1 Fucose permease [Treponema bryantii]